MDDDKSELSSDISHSKSSSLISSTREIALLTFSRGDRRTGIGGDMDVEDDAGRLSAERKFSVSARCEGRGGTGGVVSEKVDVFRGFSILIVIGDIG